MRTAPAFVYLLLLVTPLWAQDEEPQAEHASATLVSEHAALVPGKTQYLGVTIEIDPGWHVYWLNPGETGEETKVTVTAPKGVTVGPLRWPAPVRYASGAGMVDFVYAGTVTVLVPVRLDPKAKPGTKVTIKAKASWLVCKEACFPGEAELTLTLPVAKSPGKAKAAAAFKQARARLTTPLPKGVTVAWKEDTLVVHAPQATRLVFFPLAPRDTEPKAIAKDGLVKGDTLRVRYPKAIHKARAVRGLLELHRQGKTTFHWVELKRKAPG